jgi:hypothetical protein
MTTKTVKNTYTARKLTIAAMDSIVHNAEQGLAAYDKAIAGLRGDCPSGIRDNNAAKFYQSALDYVVPRLAKVRGVSEESVLRNIRRVNAGDTWIAPKEEVSKDAQELKATAFKTKARAKQRAMSKIKKDLSGKGIKRSSEELQELAEEQYAAQQEVSKERGAQEKHNARAKKMISDLVAFIGTDSKCGNGDTTEVMAALVAVTELIGALL